MKISAVTVFHNELEFLTGWYNAVKEYADEIIMAAHSPTDGSLEWAKELQSKNDIPITVLEFPEDTIYKHGFSYMKNACLDHATGDWVVSLDADEEMEITKETLEPLTKNNVCISTITMHVADRQPHWSLDNRDVIKKEANWIRQRHFRIFRNVPDLRWHGLIHEELKLNSNIHIASIARSSIFKMWHFGCMGNKDKRWFKDGLYAELLCRIVENPELRHGTNPWWYNTYYNDNKELLQQQRKTYLEAVEGKYGKIN